MHYSGFITYLDSVSNLETLFRNHRITSYNVCYTKLLRAAVFTVFTFLLAAQGSRDKMDQGKSEKTAVPPPGFNGSEWVKPSEKELKNELTDLQFQVTQYEGTEYPFQNEFWDNRNNFV